MRWMLVASVTAVAATTLVGCASPPQSPVAATPPAVARATPSIALEREIRYYHDEQGAVWDDRGRRVDGANKPATPDKP
jgi:hypothetical protein